MTKTNFQFGTVGSPKTTPKNPGGSVGAIVQSAALGLTTLELGWVHSVRVKVYLRQNQCSFRSKRCVS